MVSVMLYLCMFCVVLSIKQFGICLGVFVILMFNVMELLCVVGGLV